jgi:hypothetical protein
MRDGVPETLAGTEDCYSGDRPTHKPSLIGGSPL